MTEVHERIDGDRLFITSTDLSGSIVYSAVLVVEDPARRVEFACADCHEAKRLASAISHCVAID